MGRIGDKFESLRGRKEKALIVYLTAGDPSLERHKEINLWFGKGGSGYSGNWCSLFRSHSRWAGDSGGITARPESRDHS